ncbi:MAG: DNA alkylation repair protein [Leptospirillia bacterium]
MTAPAPLESRKPARRMSEVPDVVRAALNRGEIDSMNLVEWLSVDQAALLDALLPEMPLKRVKDLQSEAKALAEEGVMRRVSGIGQALFRAARNEAVVEPVLGMLAAHRSDMVREWACYFLAADPELSAKDLLTRMLPFAADAHMGIRECAWLAYRPIFMAHLAEGFDLVAPLTASDDPNLRRFASELTRPCGVWCSHIPELKKSPEPGLVVLDPLRADDHRYVQTSVGNWLNDASKTRPDWVTVLAARWLDREDGAATRWTLRHGTRTLRKQGTLKPALQKRLDAKG